MAEAYLLYDFYSTLGKLGVTDFPSAVAVTDRRLKLSYENRTLPGSHGSGDEAKSRHVLDQMPSGKTDSISLNTVQVNQI